MKKLGFLTTALLMGAMMAPQPSHAQHPSGYLAGESFRIDHCTTGPSGGVLAVDVGGISIGLTDPAQIAMVAPLCANPSVTLTIDGSSGSYLIAVGPPNDVLVDPTSNSFSNPSGQWTLISNQAYLNGAPAGYTSGVIRLVNISQMTYQENRFGKWWMWNDDGSYWIPAVDPR